MRAHADRAALPARSGKPLARAPAARAPVRNAAGRATAARAEANGAAAPPAAARASADSALSRSDYWGVLAPIFKRVPKYARLAWAVLRSRSVARRHKSLLYFTLVYTFSPLHMLAGPIPVVAQVDSILLLLLGIRQALAHAPSEKVDLWLDRYGLDPGQLDRDLHVATFTAWRALGGLTAPVGREAKFIGRLAGGFGGRVLKRVQDGIVAVAEQPGESRSRR